MARKPKKVTLCPVCYADPDPKAPKAALKWTTYIVTTAANTLEPEVGAYLTSAEVAALMKTMVVQISLPKDK